MAEWANFKDEPSFLAREILWSYLFSNKNYGKAKTLIRLQSKQTPQFDG